MAILSFLETWRLEKENLASTFQFSNIYDTELHRLGCICSFKKKKKKKEGCVLIHGIFYELDELPKLTLFLT